MTEQRNITSYKQQLRQRILDTAMKAFATQGIRAVRMDDISQSLGISKRTLYELYTNKEDLLLEGIRTYRDMKEKEMERAVSQCHNVMEIVLYAYRTKVEEFKLVTPSFYEDLVKYPRVKSLMAENHEQHHKRMMEFLHRGVSEGYFRSDIDYELVLQMFEAIGNHIIAKQLYFQYSMEQLIKCMAISSLRGICTAQGISILDKEL